MHFIGNAGEAVVGLVEVVVAMQQSKHICIGQHQATLGPAVLSVLSGRSYIQKAGTETEHIRFISRVQSAVAD
jgi:hypothetical protein